MVALSSQLRSLRDAVRVSPEGRNCSNSRRISAITTRITIAPNKTTKSTTAISKTSMQCRLHLGSQTPPEAFVAKPTWTRPSAHYGVGAVRCPWRKRPFRSRDDAGTEEQ